MCAGTAKKANHILGYLMHSRGRRSKAVVIPSIQCQGGHIWILCPVLGIIHKGGAWSKSAELCQMLKELTQKDSKKREDATTEDISAGNTLIKEKSAWKTTNYLDITSN